MKKILIVDDDRMARGAVKRALEDAGYEIHEAENGKVALALATENHPDLIMTDRQMPEMGGQELLDSVRATDWGKSLPIVMLTANEDTDALNEALESNITLYFTKTMALDDIVTSLKQLL